MINVLPKSQKTQDNLTFFVCTLMIAYQILTIFDLHWLAS